MGEYVKEGMVHAVCVPFPAQGHITPMLQLAKFLNSKGMYISFVNTQHNHHSMFTSNGPDSLKGTSSFKFETFPDGLPPSNTTAFRDMPALVRSLQLHCIKPFMELLYNINNNQDSPPITLFISDVHLPFARDIARNLGDYPVVLFYPPSAYSFLANAHLDTLLEKGLLPFKDPNFMSDGSIHEKLDDYLPPSLKDIQLKDFSSFIRSTDKENPLFEYMRDLMNRCHGVPLIFNTFNALDHDILHDISTLLVSSPIYTIGPLHCLANNVVQDNAELRLVGCCNMWREDTETLNWLDSKEPNSVLYVSFGTTSFMTDEQLVEFSWGIANSKCHFLWIIRADMVIGGSSSSIIPPEFLDEVKDRGMVSSWCAQEKVLNHPSIKVYLSHSGWNSTLESISSGVPLICWPTYADQQINCWYCCKKLGVGIEMEGITNRNEVEGIIREAMVMDEELKGQQIKIKVMGWKRLAAEAMSVSGSSTLDCHRFINYIFSLMDKNNLSTN